MSKEENKIKIDYKQVLKMHAHYQYHIGKHLTEYYKRPETSSIWFDKNEIKKFFEEFLHNIDSESGLRFYLCEYEPDTLPPTSRKEDMERLTIAFVATRYNSKTGKHEDIHEENFVDPRNHGKICPPEDCP